MAEALGEGKTASRVIYFPYISVPENAWFSRVLLYWDVVGSIVPEAFARNLKHLSPYMAELVRAELVRPIPPGTFEEQLFPALAPFLKFLDTDPEILARARLRLGGAPAARGETGVGTVMQIHRDKLGQSAAYELERRGLARRAQQTQSHESWFEVESRTASAFMVHLAAALGRIMRMVPITDHMAYLAPFTRSEGAGRDPLALARELRMGVLEAVLPGPVGGVSVSEIAGFKEEHGDLLVKFRRQVEMRVLDLALIEDEAVRTAKLELVSEELSEGVRDLEGKMRARKWPRLVFGTFCGVVGAAIPVGTAVAVGAVPVAAAGIPGLASAVYSAYAAVGSGKDFLRDPLAYAALARERLA